MSRQSSFEFLILICFSAVTLQLSANNAGAQQLTQPNNVSPVLRVSPPKASAVIPSTNPTSALRTARAQQVRTRDVAAIVFVPPPLKTDPDSPLGSALASCGKDSNRSEPFSLPGGKGDVKLDQCYRGRAQHICANNVLLKEGRSLLQNYGKIIDARYPELSNVGAVCAINPQALSSDVQKALEFTDRFRVLSAEYGKRANCASRVSQSLREVVLPDMAQAPEIIKSMVESLEADSKDLFAVQGQVVEIAARIDASGKAMATIGKIHQTMCVKEQRADAVSESKN